MKTTNILFLGLLSFCFFFSSCLTTRHTNLLQDNRAQVDEINEKEALDEYKICSGDELRVTVLSLNPETNTLFSLFSPTILSEQNQQSGNSGLASFTVYPDGTIDFPYIGSVLVKGKTTLEVKLLLEEKLAVITRDCSVQVSLNNRYFSVIGESTVGRYQIVKEKTTIFQALAQARDIKPYGDRTRVKLIRQTDTGTVIREFNVQSESVVNSDFYYIQPNDVIYVQPMSRQFWGISSFGAVFAVLSTVTSIGLMIYNFVK